MVLMRSDRGEHFFDGSLMFFVLKCPFSIRLGLKLAHQVLFDHFRLLSRFLLYDRLDMDFHWDQSASLPQFFNTCILTLVGTFLPDE